MVHIAEGPFTFEKGGHRGVIPACGVYFALIMVPAATNKEVVFKGSLAARKFWPRIPLMQNFFEKSLADTNSMKTGSKEVTQKL